MFGEMGPDAAYRPVGASEGQPSEEPSLVYPQQLNDSSLGEETSVSLCLQLAESSNGDRVQEEMAVSDTHR